MRSGEPAGEGKRAVREFATGGLHPRLKGLVVEASRALARLDADRLEELALSCQALNRDLVFSEQGEGPAWAEQVREAAVDMAVYARVLEATRANLNVMQRLRELRDGRLEYSEKQVRGWKGPGSEHGDN
jgi:hypothetical protein